MKALIYVLIAICLLGGSGDWNQLELHADVGLSGVRWSNGDGG